MTSVVKSTDPTRRMGVYKKLSEVPDRYRLHQHANAYRDRDVWGEWTSARAQKRELSDSYWDITETTERSWKAHMNDRGRHHALATPADVDTWIADLLPDRIIRTVYELYWARIETFYDWLQSRTDHEHVYHPVLMAAANHEAAGKVWDHKIQTGRNAAKRRAEGGQR